MKKLMILILPLFLWAESYEEVMKLIDNSLSMQSALKLQESADMLYKSSKGANLPKFDLSLNAVRLRETPTVIFHLPTSSYPLKAPMGTKSRYEGSMGISYPVFSGFAISSLIDKAKWQKEEARLKVLDLKRKLHIKATTLYSAILSLKETIKAQKEALKATVAALEKAKGLYKNGLLPPSDLYNIKAHKFETESMILESEGKKEELLNDLGSLVNKQIKDVEPFMYKREKLDKEEILKSALKNRADILALKSVLKTDEADIDLAKSRYYPTIAVSAALKRKGDSLRLNGDGYTNADESYIGTQIKWNLFNGFSDRCNVEAARLKKLSLQKRLQDYINLVKTEIDNAFLRLKTIKAKIKSAKMRLKAQEEYYRLTKGRFENQLSSADELSRAIASLSKAKAKLAALKNELFRQEVYIKLLGGINLF